MSFTNTPERYGVISAAFHWLSAIIVYGMFALGLWMVTLSYYDGWYHKAPELHKSIGILLMMGLVIRVLWRVISPPPGPLPSYSPMTRLAAKAGHLALYLLLFAIGISGYLISTADGKPISVFGWFDVPATLADAGAQADFAGALHFWLAWSVVVLSVMHGFMALKHHQKEEQNHPISSLQEGIHFLLKTQNNVHPSAHRSTLHMESHNLL